MQQLEDNLKGQIQNLDIDLNAKIMAIDTNSNSRITTLTEQIVSQRKEDILTFSDNLNQIAKVFLHQISYACTMSFGVNQPEL